MSLGFQLSFEVPGPVGSAYPENLAGHQASLSRSLAHLGSSRPASATRSTPLQHLKGKAKPLLNQDIDAT